jgi:hypothetical protein
MAIDAVWATSANGGKQLLTSTDRPVEKNLFLVQFII